MIDIRGKFSEIRELMRVRQEMQVEARKMGWMEQVILPSKTSEVIIAFALNSIYIQGKSK